MQHDMKQIAYQFQAGPLNLFESYFGFTEKLFTLCLKRPMKSDAESMYCRWEMLERMVAVLGIDQSSF
jgi:hypothetical protein